MADLTMVSSVLLFSPVLVVSSSSLSPSSFLSLSFQWVAVGVNVSGFGVGGVWALIFHLGLAGKGHYIVVLLLEITF